MMFEARVDGFHLSVPASLLLAALLLFGSLAASAQSNPPVQVYHSLDPQGVDPRAGSPVGCAGGNVLMNGDFEAGSLTSWQTRSREGSSGSFSADSGTTTPISESSSAGAKSGSYYAVSDQSSGGDATHVLAQEFYIPPGAAQVMLSFDMFVNNWGDGTVVREEGLDHGVEGSNQFASVSLITAAGFAADPYTSAPAHLVRSFFSGADAPSPDAESPHPYTSYAFDITSNVSGGGNFVIRFAETNNTGSLNLGVDNVSITTPWGNCVIRGRAGEQVELWIDGGPAPGQPEPIEYLCKMGEDGSAGDQLCGADLSIALVGIGEFTSFEPAPVGMETLVYRPECVGSEGECFFPGGTKQIRMNFTRGASDPLALPRYVGRLTLDSRGVTPETETSVKIRGFTAGGKLQIRPIGDPLDPITIVSSNALPVPEPAQLLQLLCGVVGLRLLERRRR
jgi:hypothetical protein